MIDNFRRSAVGQVSKLSMSKTFFLFIQNSRKLSIA